MTQAPDAASAAKPRRRRRNRSDNALNTAGGPGATAVGAGTRGVSDVAVTPALKRQELGKQPRQPEGEDACGHTPQPTGAGGEGVERKSRRGGRGGRGGQGGQQGRAGFSSAAAPAPAPSNNGFAPLQAATQPLIEPASPTSSIANGSALSKLRYTAIAGLSAESKRAMAEGFGYEFATPVQAATIEPALAGRDLLSRARTGTGKTLGFVLPVIERICAAGNGGNRTDIRAVIVSPTRELASQIAVEAERVCKYHGKNMGVQLVVGGTSRKKEESRMAAGPNTILVCTPGRFHDHVENTSGFKSKLKGTNVAVLDEVRALSAAWRCMCAHPHLNRILLVQCTMLRICLRRMYTAFSKHFVDTR
jgi:DEAD/DEAH box helicase